MGRKKNSWRKTFTQLPVEVVEEGDLLSQMELEIEAEKRRYGESNMDKRLRALPAESNRPKACPQCGQRTTVRRKRVARTFETLSGSHTIERNYHYCNACGDGFYPLDRLLGLPEEGELSAQLEKRVLDFAVTEVYQDAAERFIMHYGYRVSANLFRQVARRMGTQLEECESEKVACQLLRPSNSPAEVLYARVDGSQLPM